MGGGGGGGKGDLVAAIVCGAGTVAAKQAGTSTYGPGTPCLSTGSVHVTLHVKVVTALWQQVNGAVPDLTSALPCELFPESGADLKFVQHCASDLSGVLCVRIVDKGAGEVWGFCATWVWDIVHEFLQKEGYTAIGLCAADVTTLMQDVVTSKGWPTNPKTQLCRLYLIDKAKSLVKKRWLWRPIAASPNPVVNKTSLRI